jgi:hypothetical protein
MWRDGRGFRVFEFKGGYTAMGDGVSYDDPIYDGAKALSGPSP